MHGELRSKLPAFPFRNWRLNKLARRRPNRGFVPVEALESRLLLTEAPVPVFNSNPDASKTLYLDFNETRVPQYEAPGGGMFTNIVIPTYDLDGDDSTFNATELEHIELIWETVAEDFAPFDVNVTTVDPGSFPDGVALKVAIGGSSNDLAPGFEANGYALRDAFTSSNPNVVFAFPFDPVTLTIRDRTKIGTTASHEAAHGFGLRHQMKYDENGEIVDPYHRGNGVELPIMGNSVLTIFARDGIWWDSTGVTTPDGQPAQYVQDDMAVLAATLGYRTDDPSSPTPLTYDPDSNALVSSRDGELEQVIQHMTDIDRFTFTVDGGSLGAPVKLFAKVDVHDVNPNLDVAMLLLDADGNIVDSDDPDDTTAASLNAQIRTEVLPGDYTIVVKSHGDYGDVGQYTVSVKDQSGPRIIDARPGPDRRLRVTFDEAIDADTFTEIDVKIAQTPNGPLEQLAGTVIEQVNDRTFDIVIPPLTPGGLKLHVGPSVLDLFGNRMNQDGATNPPFEFVDFDGPSPLPLPEGLEHSYGNIRVNFDEPIDADTMTVSNVIVSGPNGAAVAYDTPQVVEGSNGEKWDIAVDSFPAGGFVVTLQTGITDVFGNHLAASTDLDYIDHDGPKVVTTTLANPGPVTPYSVGAVSQSRNMLVTFDEPIDPASFDASDVKIYDPSGNLLAVHSINPHSGQGFNQTPAPQEYENWMISFGTVGGGYGTYTIEIGPHVTDFFHNEMNQFADAMNGQSNDVYVGTFDIQPSILEKPVAFVDSEVGKYLDALDGFKPLFDPYGPYAEGRFADDVSKYGKSLPVVDDVYSQYKNATTVQNVEKVSEPLTKNTQSDAETDKMFSSYNTSGAAQATKTVDKVFAGSSLKSMLIGLDKL